MINHIRIKQIEYELILLQQKKENYEDCCIKFKNEIIDEGKDIDWMYKKHFDQSKDIDKEMNDLNLIDFIENNQEFLKQAQEMRDELIKTIDKEDQNHRLQCEAKEDELRKELALLAVM